MIVVLIKTNTANRLKLITVGVGFSFGNPIIHKDEYLLFYLIYQRPTVNLCNVRKVSI